MKYLSKLVLLAMAVVLIGRAAEAQGRFDGVDCCGPGDDCQGEANEQIKPRGLCATKDQN